MLYTKYIPALLLLLLSTLSNLGFSQTARQMEIFTSGNKEAEVYYYVQYEVPGLNNAIMLFRNGNEKNVRQTLDLQNAREGFLWVVIDEVKRMRSRDKFFIKKTCAAETAHLKFDNSRNSFPIEIKSRRNNQRKTIRYKVVKNGEGSLIIKIGALNRNEISNEAECRDRKITINYKIENLYEPPPRIKKDDPIIEVVSPEERDWPLVDKTKTEELSAFLSKYSDSQYKGAVITMLKNLDARLWNSTDKDDIKSLQKYLAKAEGYQRWVNKNRRRATAKITEIEGGIRIEEEWGNFMAKNPDEQAITAFIGDTKWNKQKASDLLMRNHPNLEYEKSENGNSTYTVKITNAYFNPRYKNISVSSGLVIDDSRWKEEHLLTIKVTQNEQFKILVRDSLERETTIPFGNTFEVNMETSDTAYTLKILGGVPPYHIRLYNNETLHEGSFDTNKNQYVFNKKTLTDQKFIGEYAVNVSYKNGPKEIELPESFFLEKQGSDKVLLIGLLAFVVLFGGGYLFMTLRKRRNNNLNIFNS